MKYPIRYTFQHVDHCNMCGDPTASHKVLGQRMNQQQGFRPRSKHGIATTVMKCTRCELIYANPQPVPFDIQDHYGIPPENYWKPEYFEISPSYFSYEIDTFLKLSGKKNDIRSLDIGAGLGKGMIAQQRRGFDAYGFEPSASFHKMAIDKMKLSPERLQQGMLESINYEENFFDFVTFGAVLEHLYDPAAAIERAMHWLKPGGLMHIEVPSSKHLLATLIDLYYSLIGTPWVTHLSPMHEPFHLYEFGLKSFELHQQRTKAYTIAFHEYYVCTAEPFPKVIQPVLQWIMSRTDRGMQLAIWLKKN